MTAAAPAIALTGDPLTDDRPLAGIALCVFALFLFSLQDVIIKLFSERYSVLQLVFVRGVVALAPIVIAVRVTCGWRGFVAHKPKLLIARGLLGFVSYLTYYMAIAALPLAEVVMILFSAPILVTVMSALWLREPVGRRRWTALAVGFVAIVMVIRPGGDLGDVGRVATLLAFAAATAYAGQNVITRFIGAGDRPWTITLYTMLAFVAGSVVASVVVAVFGAGVSTTSSSLQFLLRPWSVPPLADAMLMIFIGLNASLAFYCLIKAYWVSPASIVAPFEYTYIIWAVAFGYLIWDEVPRATGMVGVALLIGCSLYIFRKEQAANGRAGDAAGNGRRRRWPRRPSSFFGRG